MGRNRRRAKPDPASQPLRIEGAEDSLRSSKAGYAPVVDAFVRYSNNNGGTSIPTAGQSSADTELTSFGVELSMPLFTGGLTTSQVRESTYRLTQAEQSSEAQRRRVVENTRNLYRTVTSSVEEVSARRQAIISAKAALDATQTGYEVGTRNVVDVLDAQRNLFRTVRDYNTVRYNYIINNLNLKLAAGTLSPQDLQDLSQWLNPKTMTRTRISSRRPPRRRWSRCRWATARRRCRRAIRTAPPSSPTTTAPAGAVVVGRSGNQPSSRAMPASRRPNAP
ncbi:TolC family protein [Halopseudomonas pachastrellae]|nr:TolC family protein [Halopseudomonas pachastrellae]